ncbi:hypothetical protein BU16DRAFT_567467 [Lophium mytilinum]|uniref:Uncharacterized protein n=1 Tax=Lophium mytilinum TaxID=390894 RepID=A0A6A6QBA7_9PEZI|nr:hypothetical protein BU16DRAFT_567467 [Lophium mytilinum]
MPSSTVTLTGNALPAYLRQRSCDDVASTEHFSVAGCRARLAMRFGARLIAPEKAMQGRAQSPIRRLRRPPSDAGRGGESFLMRCQRAARVRTTLPKPLPRDRSPLTGVAVVLAVKQPSTLSDPMQVFGSTGKERAPESQPWERLPASPRSLPASSLHARSAACDPGAAHLSSLSTLGRLIDRFTASTAMPPGPAAVPECRSLSWPGIPTWLACSPPDSDNPKAYLGTFTVAAYEWPSAVSSCCV